MCKEDKGQAGVENGEQQQPKKVNGRERYWTGQQQNLYFCKNTSFIFNKDVDKLEVAQGRVQKAQNEN